MKDYHLIIFDLDGTLLDTSEGILSSVRYTIDRFGFRELPEEVLRSFIGPPIQDSFSVAYGLEGPILQEIATVFRDRYKSTDLLKAKPYPGIFEALERLKSSGKRLAVATYKREDYALDILRHFGFDRFFSVMHGGDHENRLKKPDIIRLCIDETEGANEENSLLVGDTLSDSSGAEKVGIDFLGVSYGFGFRSPADASRIKCVGIAGSASETADYCLGQSEKKLVYDSKLC